MADYQVALSEANNYLALNLHWQLSTGGENLFFSPFSISTALAMLFCGSTDETNKEMREVIGYDLAKIKDEDVRISFQSLLEDLDNNEESYTLACANYVLSRDDFSVKEEYKSLLEESFKASLEEVDFKDKAEAEAAVKKINDWVKEKTRGMISEALESLGKNTAMVLVNAVYFKGSWLHEFQKDGTSPQNFYNKGKDIKKIEMMKIVKKFEYSENKSFKALQLPYKGGEVAMLILLPNDQKGLKQLEESLETNFVRDITDEMKKVKVRVALPKFRMKYSKNLNKHLQDLGMNRLFSPGAQFGGISDSDDLQISEIKHKAVLIVNEEGSEAAAVTGATVIAGISPQKPEEFIVDHPFLFVIYNSQSNMILFMGRVEEL